MTVRTDPQPLGRPRLDLRPVPAANPVHAPPRVMTVEDGPVEIWQSAADVSLLTGGALMLLVILGFTV